MPDYEAIFEKFEETLKNLREITPTFHSVDNLKSEEDEAAFVQTFRRLMRNMNVLQSYTDFDWDELPLGEHEIEDYKRKYLDLYENVKRETKKEKISILYDIDFELEQIHRDRINVAYIIKLLAKLKDAKTMDAKAQ